MNNKENIESLKKIKLILVDDNIPFRNALKKLLQIKYGCEIIAEVSDGLEFMNLTNIHNADIILMDLMMPNLDGLTATRDITWKYPFLKIVAITMHYEKTYLKDLIERGFKGCIYKSNLFDDIVEALITVIQGGLFFPKELLHPNN